MQTITAVADEARIPVLDNLKEPQRRILESYLEERCFAAGDRFIRQGDAGDGCYVIQEGSVRVEFVDEKQERPSVLGYLYAGALVGEMSIIGQPIRSADVYAQTDVRLRWLSSKSYAGLGRSAPEVALEFTQLLAQDMAYKIRQINSRLASYVAEEATPAEADAIVARAAASQNRFTSSWVAQFLADVPTDVEIIDAFLNRGINTVCMVADSILSSMDQYLMDLAGAGRVNRWVLPSERSVPAVAVGRWLATGELSLMTMQNSGFSNAMDYLRSVMQTHRIPGIVLASWRGFDAMLDDSEPHILIGDLTESDTVSTMGREHVYGERSGVGLAHDIAAAIEDARQGSLVCIRVSPPGFKKVYPLKTVADSQVAYLDQNYYAEVTARKGVPFSRVQEKPLLSRDEALREIHGRMEELNPFYIVGNGFNPRAMQGLRLTGRTFENAGGMGSSLAIAWGAAKSDPETVFVAIDGDQNAAMSEMEKVLVSDYPDNLYWFILNNRIGESVGPSVSLPLCPWHYDLAHVINTRSEPPGSFKYCRINNSGLKFADEGGQTMAREMGNLPAQAHLARRILAERGQGRT